MSQDARVDHRRLREITREYCEYQMKRFPQTAEEHEVVLWYNSFEAFVAAFPKADQRDRLLARLEKFFQEMDEAAEFTTQVIQQALHPEGTEVAR